MKRLSLGFIIGATVLLSAFTIQTAINWKIAEGYSIKFKGVDAEGIFKNMTGTLLFSETDLASSSFSVSVDVSSINTGNGMKNKHAVSDKWFDAEKYPNINFVSSGFSKTTAGYEVEGTLDLHGVKKTVKIPFTFVANTFAGKLKVNRMDYGVGTMDGPSAKVGNEMEIELSVPVTKK